MLRSNLPRCLRCLDLGFGSLSALAGGKDMRWFGNPQTDVEVKEQFGSLTEDVLGDDATLKQWATHSLRTKLALVVIMDQFCRNLYRGSGKAFAQAKRAEDIVVKAIEDKEYRNLSFPERAVFFLPLMHAENPKLQDLSVAMYSELAEDVKGTPYAAANYDMTLRFAERHREIVAQFGRFPKRNLALGRKNTAEEQEYLDDNDDMF